MEENKAIIRRVMEAVNKRDLVLLDELISPGYVDTTLRLKGLKGFKQSVTSLYEGFPDIHATIDDIIAEGDKVWDRVTLTATHTGKYRGLASTGKKIAFKGVRIWRIVNSKVVERESFYDFLDFYKQLGIIEYKGFPDEVP
ncbi:ester cyclase [Candidatus Bathyarchaeota archaeon]|nr:ester cyclase [Candidatus Bathyarchaeota archaeon]